MSCIVNYPEVSSSLDRAVEDREPGYSYIGIELIESYKERLKEQVDEERYLLDSYSVADLAMK